MPGSASAGGQDARVVVVLASESSRSPSELAVACSGFAELYFLADSSDPASERLLAVARNLAPTIVANFSDKDACLAAVRQASPAAVTTFVDRLCPFASWLNNEACGYRGNQIDWGRKDLQRDAMRVAGVSRVRSSLVANASELRAFAGQVGFPCVVKPLDGSGGRDAWRLDGQPDLDAFSAATQARPGGWPSGLYAEEYIVGQPTKEPWLADYNSADVFRPDHPDAGESPALVTSRTPLAWPFRETGVIVPSPLPEPEQNTIATAARKALDAIRATRGTFHVEVKSAPYGPELIEVNHRLGGFIGRATQLASGTDLGQLALGCALGRIPVLEPRWQRCVYAMFYQAPTTATRIVTTPRRRELLRRPGVISIDEIAGTGTSVHWKNGMLGMAARLFLTGDSHAELRERIIDTIQFLDDSFQYVDDSGHVVRDQTWLESISRQTAQEALG